MKKYERNKKYVKRKCIISGVLMIICAFMSWFYPYISYKLVNQRELPVAPLFVVFTVAELCLFVSYIREYRKMN